MPSQFLTREGYEKLQRELDDLRTVKRAEIATRLHEAMEGGELIENAEYEAAKNEQAFVEGRIKELELILATARLIVDDSAVKDTVQVGSRVTIQEKGMPAEVYVIVGAAEANPAEGKISNESPLGRAVLGHHVGDEVTVDAPDGSFTVTIRKLE